MTLHFSRKRITLSLLLIALVLGILSYATAAYEWSLGVDNTYWAHEAALIFGVIYEGNVPSYFSAMLLIMAAALAGLIFLLEKRLGWGAMALVLAYMSMDEAAELHESFTVPMREGFQLEGFLYFGWILIGIPLALIVGAAFLPFVLKLPRFCLFSFILAGAIYLTGALVVESYSATLWAETQYPTLPYHAVSLLEEWMEMGGVILVVHSLLWYLEKEIGEMKVVVD